VAVSLAGASGLSNVGVTALVGAGRGVPFDFIFVCVVIFGFPVDIAKSG
jgi:hypothetical protein